MHAADPGQLPNIELKEMHLNWFTLRFTGPTAALEQSFQSDYVARTLPHVRVALVIATLMYGIFGILDSLLVPNDKYIPHLIRYAFVCPAILATLGVTYLSYFHRYLQQLICFMFVFSSFGIIMMIAVIPPPVSYYYYAGLILIFIFAYSFIYLRFLWASLGGWIIVILYEIAALLTNTPVTVLISNNFFLVSANIAGIVVCYTLEYSNRKNYFLLRLLEQERCKIQETNEQLERRVAERTETLENINRQLTEEMINRKKAEEGSRELEERLLRAEKMEALGMLAGGVAHDLNNDLGIIVGYSELLVGAIGESSTLSPYVMNIMSGGERAAAIVQDMLTLARRGVRTERVVNLSTTIIDCLKTPEFEKLCSLNHNIQVKTNLESGLLNILGSPVHLGKTVMNLVTNAVEAMPNGGTVTMATSNQYLDRPVQGYDHVREGEYVVLSVSDTGGGIPAADMKHIFEPFYTKKVMGRSGTGLGLSVVWGAVKDHNGYIDVRSEEGRGSTFTLYFPVTREKISEDQASPSTSEYTGSGESILVVDDSEGQRELASQMLNKLNYRVATVGSGEDAVEYVKANKVALIILDMIMDPGMDGLDTYKKILEISPKQKAIIVSGFSETDRVNQAQALGAGAYVKKPYVLERLGLAVRKELIKT